MSSKGAPRERQPHYKGHCPLVLPNGADTLSTSEKRTTSQPRDTCISQSVPPQWVNSNIIVIIQSCKVYQIVCIVCLNKNFLQYRNVVILIGIIFT